ncbi:ABC transporter substrate-binding protein [Longispora fulva]|uniref:Peptide/nickel transport system substrate-binding protein n=1 Tax=Longispora fulva TaxID=619741 RepID=A0A8J7KPK0_9ACTN|nr:ABC transporter substrate-binding protein [Longispora fulva]MBG6136392.1 peptide/nickel transport system substrate-binding protein [Longispora fulva]GIG59560.1 ABC transporter substrate-binding protein [Longispora fulva]
MFVPTRRGLLLGGAALTGGVLLGGCSTPAGTPKGAPSPKKGGRVRAAFQTAGAKETLDPHAASLFVDGARSKALFDKLADLGPDMSPVPRLAEKFEPNADATKWRVTLRKATFHDGRPVTADDVLASYARILAAPATRRAAVQLDAIDLKASSAVSAQVIEFVLKRPQSEFPLATTAFGSWIVPKDLTDFTRPVGSGPFRFASFAAGGTLVVDRFDGYWDSPAHLDRVEFVPANEETARINALVGGQVEYAHDLSAASARTYATDKRIAVHRAPGSAMHAFAMKLDRAPFDKPEVRAAFRLMVDREELVRTVLGGMGSIGNDLFGKGYQYYADLPQRTRDLDKAKALLKQAGADGLKVPLQTAPAGAGLVEAATLFAEQAKAAGVTLDVAVGNKDTFFKDTLSGGAISSYRSGSMPIDTHLASRLLTTSPQNVTKWGSPEFDALYRTMQSTVDPAARTAAYKDMQVQLHERCGLLVWGFADWIVGTSAGLNGVADAPPNTLDWARFDKVWLA